MDNTSVFETLLHAARLKFPGIEILLRSTKAADIHLFSAPNSICSQKVRAVLFETGQSFVSHTLDIFKGDTYDPDYVRLRLTGCSSAGLPLATDHPGSTSATMIGCDACVVPTVAYASLGDVIVDSKNICIDLDLRNSAAPGALMPDEHAYAIESELHVVDNLPNYQLLAIAVGKPDKLAANNSFAISKVRRCDALIAENADNIELREAYMAKRAKEQAAADRLFDPSAMERAQNQIRNALEELDKKLRRRSGPYLFGSTITMADLFWGVELIRIDDLGLSSCWSNGNLPSLSAYYRRISELPSVSAAVTNWAGARLNVKPALRP